MVLFRTSLEEGSPASIKSQSTAVRYGGRTTDTKRRRSRPVLCGGPLELRVPVWIGCRAAKGGARDAVSGTEVSALLRDGCWSSRATGEGAVLAEGREMILPRRSEARARAVRVAYCWPPSGAPGGGGRGGGWRQLPIEEGAGRHLRRSPGRLGPIAGDDVNPRWTSSTQASRPREPSAPGERPYHLRKNGKRQFGARRAPTQVRTAALRTPLGSIPSATQAH